jgi:CheY-like chemotaxis protein
VFTLCLPFAASLPVMPAVPARLQTSSIFATRLHIMVVDDNVDAATTLAALLGMQGHEVRTAHDGIEALDMLRDFAPDVAILDIGMPKMNGYTLAARIRENMREAQPLLIAVTGWGQEDARRRSKAAGFDHHLVKPVDPGALAALLAVPSGRTLH